MKYADDIPAGIELVSDTVVRKHARFSNYEVDRLVIMQDLILHLMNQHEPMIVPVYRFEYEGNKNSWHSYSYDMKRLGILSKFEKSLVDLVGDANSFGNPTPYEFNVELRPDQADLMVKGWEKKPKLMMFLRDIILQDRYHDLHSGNIMMDENDDYKIIDLEGFIHGSLENRRYDWITTLRSGSHQPTAATWQSTDLQERI